jgi:hypothetical protein
MDARPVIIAGMIAQMVGAGTLLTREPSAERTFVELKVRANTGLGSEKASPHER